MAARAASAAENSVAGPQGSGMARVELEKYSHTRWTAVPGMAARKTEDGSSMGIGARPWDDEQKHRGENENGTALRFPFRSLNLNPGNPRENIWVLAATLAFEGISKWA